MELKLIEPHEIGPLFKILSDPEIAKNLTAIPSDVTESNLGAFLLATDPSTRAVAFGIHNKGTLAGCITLNNISHIKNSAYLGVVAVASGMPGMLGIRAARWLVNHCFFTLNLNRVYSHTWSDNSKMDTFYKTLGAVHEGTEREQTWKDGRYVDMKIWGILRSDWESKNTK